MTELLKMPHLTINRVVSLQYNDVPLHMDNQPFFNFSDYLDPRDRDKRHMRCVGNSWFVDDEGGIKGLSPTTRSYWFVIDHETFGDADESFDNIISSHSIFVQVERELIYDVPSESLTRESYGDAWAIDSDEILMIHGTPHLPIVTECTSKLVKANGVVVFSGSL